MLKKWADNPAGQPLDMMVEMMAVTLDMVSQTMYSTNIMNDQKAVTPDAVNITISYAFNKLQNPFTPPLSWPTPGNRRFRKVVADLDDLMYRLIAQRRALNERKNDLLDMLLYARDEETGEGMTDKQLRDEMLTMLAAGHETTGVSLTWTLYLLSQHPDIVRRLQKEIDTVLGGRTPTLEDLPNLPYALQVFEEAMRLYPVALLIPRRTSQATTLGGYDLPDYSRILVSLYNLHRHPAFWPAPDVFNPDNFTAENKKKQHRYAYMPFGAGQHICIGNNMALMIGQLLLAMVYQRFNLSHVSGHKVENYATLTLRPRYGIVMTLHPRNGN
jgi:cytochrome P450